MQKHAIIGLLIFDKKGMAYLPSWPTYPALPYLLCLFLDSDWVRVFWGLPVHPHPQTVCVSDVILFLLFFLMALAYILFDNQVFFFCHIAATDKIFKTDIIVDLRLNVFDHSSASLQSKIFSVNSLKTN